jgi:hypothetical protein
MLAVFLPSYEYPEFHITFDWHIYRAINFYLTKFEYVAIVFVLWFNGIVSRVLESKVMILALALKIKEQLSVKAKWD